MRWQIFDLRVALMLSGVLTMPAFCLAAVTCHATTMAKVVAIENAYQYNRFGAFNPAGMIFALRHDVVPATYSKEEEAAYLRLSLKDRYLVKMQPGEVRLRADKRPRPLVLRVNEGDCLKVEFANLLTPLPPAWHDRDVPEHMLQSSSDATLVKFPTEESPYPATRGSSFHVNGLDYVDGPSKDDGALVGRNTSSLAMPGEIKNYTLYAPREGGYLLYSTAATTGGEGDGGQLGLGLFGSVNVEPRGSTWLRSQITYEQMQAAVKNGSYADLNYASNDIALVDSQGWLVHSDLNAIIKQDLSSKEGELFCDAEGEGTSCGSSFREFTVIFHDEITAVQAYAELEDDTNPASSVRDGMGINYGVSGMGPMVLANMRKTGPAAKCVECKFEEFFLSSWANGDPALLPQYTDDPSNVHHAYLGDPVRFRNLHAGPKETHVFHLHAHQWLYDFRDQHSTYLDSQTVSPGSSYTYAIQYGGAGNRNHNVGDSIFHCHLYPHFAQGMWELWRAHDVFEDGTRGVWNPETNPRGRWLPDGEIAGGTPTPALVPIPGLALAPLPSKEFGGYPFYIPGKEGHRAPQAPFDMDVSEAGEELNGGLPRHIVLEGEATLGDRPGLLTEKTFKETDAMDAATLGSQVTAATAKRVASLNSDPRLTQFAKRLDRATIETLPANGTAAEQVAMRFHQGLSTVADFHGFPAKSETHNTYHDPNDAQHPWWLGMGYTSPVAGQGPTSHGLFNVNGRIGRTMADLHTPQPQALGRPGAPFADPCPLQSASERMRYYRAAYLQFDLPANKWGWHDPQARIAVLEDDAKDTLEQRRPAEPLFFRANSGDCIQFAATNLIPNALNLDDFEAYSPTDIIGQHIHLVKFDVTASDGSGNGWNYEDGTLSPDEIRERIRAQNAAHPDHPLKMKTHPLFKTGNLKGDKRGWCADMPGGSDDNLWCAAQTTVQRWYADPILDRAGEDRTMRTVFTHDHFGPSSHQHHGLYAALVVEPAKSTWMSTDGVVKLGGPLDSTKKDLPNHGEERPDGGPTSYRANIVVPCDTAKAVSPTPCVSILNRREYNLAVADYSILYTKNLDPINPPVNDDIAQEIPFAIPVAGVPQPEGISTKDPGTQLFNYRNEPIPLRLTELDGQFHFQRHGKPGDPADVFHRDEDRGDPANVFRSGVHAKVDEEQMTAAGVFRPGATMTPYIQAGLERQQKRFLENLKCLSQPQETEQDKQNRALWCETWRKPGDPATPVLATYEGDNLQVRLIQGGQEEQHVFSMTGGRWLMQVSSTYPRKRWGEGGWKPKLMQVQAPGFVAGQQIGISEHMEFDMPPSSRVLGSTAPTDHLYMSSATNDLWDGLWGIVRRYPTSAPSVGLQDFHRSFAPAATPSATLTAAPGTETVRTNMTDPANVCPGQVTRKFVVGAWLARDLLDDPAGAMLNERFALHDPNAIVFVRHDPATMMPAVSEDEFSKTRALEDDDLLHRLQIAYKAGKPLEPLTLRVAAGDCILVTLHNYVGVRGDYDDRWKSEAEGGDGNTRGTHSSLPRTTTGYNSNQYKPSTSVGLAPQLLEVEMSNSGGVNVGLNEGDDHHLTTVKPGEEISYTWYAGERRVLPCSEPHGPLDCKVDSKDTKSAEVYRVQYVPDEFGGAALRNLADPIKASMHGAEGMLIVEPAGSCWAVPATPGAPTVARLLPLDRNEMRRRYALEGYCASLSDDELLDQFYRSGTTADIQVNGKPAFRDFALMYQDDLANLQNGMPLPNIRSADDSYDTGAKGFNYRSEPLWGRVGAGSPEVQPGEMQKRRYETSLSSTQPNDGCGGPCGDPATPVFTAPAGTEVRFHVVHPGGHSRQHGFALYGHNWDDKPWQWVWDAQADNKLGAWGQVMAANQYSARLGLFGGIGPAKHVNIRTCAGGAMAQPGDYLYRTQDGFQFQGGLWGIFRVTPNGNARCADDLTAGPPTAANNVETR